MLLQMQITPLTNWSTSDFVLPDGWRIEEKQRSSGASHGVVDKVFFCSQILALLPLILCNTIYHVLYFPMAIAILVGDNVLYLSHFCLGVCTGLLFVYLIDGCMHV